MAATGAGRGRGRGADAPQSAPTVGWWSNKGRLILLSLEVKVHKAKVFYIFKPIKGNRKEPMVITIKGITAINLSGKCIGSGKTICKVKLLLPLLWYLLLEA
jgi:hypothetical protein